MRTLAFMAITGGVMAAVVGVVSLLKVGQATSHANPGRDGPAHELDAPDKPEKPVACVATYERFQRLKQGYSQNAVKRIMGCEGEMVSSQRLGSNNYRSFRFDGEKPGTGVLVVFSDHVLNSFYQTGLR